MHLPSRFLILPALMLGLSSPLCAETIEVRADSWMPYNGDPAAAQPGYVVELLRAAFPNDTLNYSVCSWAQACTDLTEGKIDAIIGATTSDAPGAVIPELPIGDYRNCFYIKKGDPWRYTGINSLKSIRLAAIAGYVYDLGGPLDSYLKRAKAPAVRFGTGDNPLDDNIAQLRKGDVEVIVENPNVMHWNLIQKQATPGEIHSAGSLTKEGYPLHVAFTGQKEASVTRAEQLTATVKKMRESGELARLLERYGMNDWAK
ncbi:MAG: ABC transporter substrate-binding protein [Opitutus sp.]|nr:ABC transporter substrate-binding protein [Opitutus sp.]MCS6248276.1 ABC transporter substrate-binding protein [Opitutus sp.]MCS6274965.1 ABC transporter substrate-binding protein [Opitutus sp.]MCS6279015.1 ABC transporter substrate-binding protein [Opitutus sp.]MCS6298764.1 ABC transporter substrate-binding protein [Opitutus sp.]